jgi:hypothetical protein
MKRITTLWAALFAWASLSATPFAATNGIVVGVNLQAAIDAAAAGDTIAAESGVYPDPTINITKPLTIVPIEAGGTVSILGAMNIQSGGTNRFEHCYFGGVVQVTNSTLLFHSSTFNADVQAVNCASTFLDSTFNANGTFSAGKVTVKRTSFTSASATITLSKNADFEALRATIKPTISGVTTNGSNAKFLVVQSHLGGVSLGNYKVWIGYNLSFDRNTLNSYIQLTGCASVLIGNVYNVGSTAVTIDGGTAKLFNNVFYAGGYALSFVNAGGEIENNTFVSPGGNLIGGLKVPLILKNDIFLGLNNNNCLITFADSNSSALTFANYCAFDGACVGPASFSSPPVNCIFGQSLRLGSDYTTLSVDSPCMNAGAPQAVYNNRDGTRNTMGYTGGPYLNPANYTTDNPMVFVLTGPQTIFKGSQSSISITAAASAGH